MANYCEIEQHGRILHLRWGIDDRGDWADALDDLKASLPQHARAWDPDAKQWDVLADLLEDVKEWAKAHGLRPRITVRQSPYTAKPGAPHEPAFKTLFLQPGAPLPVVQAAYRALVKMYHPDSGKVEGTADPTKFMAVHAAYQELIK